MASAMPSSRSHSAAIRSRSAGAGALPTAAARSRNRATASDSPPPTRDSGGTGKTHSNGTISRARLVASTRIPGQATSSRSRNGATPSRTCSQLSSTSSA